MACCKGPGKTRGGLRRWLGVEFLSSPRKNTRKGRRALDQRVMIKKNLKDKCGPRMAKWQETNRCCWQGLFEWTGGLRISLKASPDHPGS